MGILSFFSPQSENRLHEQLNFIITEYHHVKALLEKERSLSEHLKQVHSRIDEMNSKIRYANSLPSGPSKMQYLQQLIHSEKIMLDEQKRLARELKNRTGDVIRLERKKEKAARDIERAA